MKNICSQIGLAIDRIKLQQELLLRNIETKKLEELNRKISYFVSGVSHEILTPLTAIKMNAELGLTGKKIDKLKINEHFEIIEGESKRRSLFRSNKQASSRNNI